jgi:hypothetical protein
MANARHEYPARFLLSIRSVLRDAAHAAKNTRPSLRVSPGRATFARSSLARGANEMSPHEEESRDAESSQRGKRRNRASERGSTSDDCNGRATCGEAGRASQRPTSGEARVRKDRSASPANAWSPPDGYAPERVACRFRVDGRGTSQAPYPAGCAGRPAGRRARGQEVSHATGRSVL